MDNYKGEEAPYENIIYCIFCGIKVDENQAWSHIDGDANMGVRKIEYFCSEDHKAKYFQS